MAPSDEPVTTLAIWPPRPLLPRRDAELDDGSSYFSEERLQVLHDSHSIEGECTFHH